MQNYNLGRPAAHYRLGQFSIVWQFTIWNVYLAFGFLACMAITTVLVVNWRTGTIQDLCRV